MPTTGLEPVRCYSLEPESSASANSATWAHVNLPSLTPRNRLAQVRQISARNLHEGTRRVQVANSRLSNSGSISIFERPANLPHLRRVGRPGLQACALKERIVGRVPPRGVRVRIASGLKTEMPAAILKESPPVAGTGFAQHSLLSSRRSNEPSCAPHPLGWHADCNA